MNKIRVLLAEDHTIVRKGLRSLLDGETGERPWKKFNSCSPMSW
jgi:DNA-binding NarL/FixJ family response regulator